MINSRILLLITMTTLFVTILRGSRLLLQDLSNLDICVWGLGGSRAGGLYEYKGEFNNKPYYKQKECIRPIGPISRNMYLFSFGNVYFLSSELGKASSTTTYCSTFNINSPLECEEWKYCTSYMSNDINSPRECKEWINSGKYGDGGIYGIYNGGCPNVLSPLSKYHTYKGIEVDILNDVGEDHVEAANLNGIYDIQLGLNMFKKSLSSTPIYLYFDPYHFDWRFITEYNEGDDLWVGSNPERETCPTYSSYPAVMSARGAYWIPFNDDFWDFTIPVSGGGVMTFTSIE